MPPGAEAGAASGPPVGYPACPPTSRSLTASRDRPALARRVARECLDEHPWAPGTSGRECQRPREFGPGGVPPPRAARPTFGASGWQAPPARCTRASCVFQECDPTPWCVRPLRREEKPVFRVFRPQGRPLQDRLCAGRPQLVSSLGPHRAEQHLPRGRRPPWSSARKGQSTVMDQTMANAPTCATGDSLPGRGTRSPGGAAGLPPGPGPTSGSTGPRTTPASSSSGPTLCGRGSAGGPRHPDGGPGDRARGPRLEPEPPEPSGRQLLTPALFVPELSRPRPPCRCTLRIPARTQGGTRP